MKDMLATEEKLTNRVGNLPDDWSFKTQAFRTPEPDMAALIFGASEYAKDGLLPLTEWLGPSPWSDRMLQLIDAIWAHAEIPSEVGPLPAESHEVCGGMMQTLSRLYWMTGKETYNEAFKLADYYLTFHNPADVSPLQLDDHGCEVIGGLSEVYYLASKTDPDRRSAWREPLYRLLDRVLEVGRNEDGLLYNKINPVTGAILNKDLTDNWGYNYNAYLVVAQVDGVARYREAVEKVLTHLLASKDFPWEGGSADGLADSLEGCLNLMNRVPTPEAEEWADYMAKRLFSIQRDTGVVEGWHGDGNFARTAIMYALWKSQGAYVEPWRADLRVGAVRDGQGVYHFVVEGDWPWDGTLRFDRPRHSENLHIPEDYPRLNQFPEWFTVTEEGVYESNQGEMPAKALREGLPVHVERDKPYYLTLKRKAAIS